MSKLDSGLPNIRTKVPRPALIAAIRTKAAVEVAEAQKTASMIKKQEKAYWLKLEAMLRKRADDVANLATGANPKQLLDSEHARNNWLLEHAPSDPESCPNIENIRGKYDTVLGLLMVSKEEMISLTPDDYQRFMAGSRCYC